MQGQFENETHTRETVKLDGSSFKGCTFKNCTMIYHGGEMPTISGCNFADCEWQFGGDAANTIAFLSGMHQGGFETLIEATFDEIRKGAMINDVSPPPEKKGRDMFKPLRVFRIPKKT